MNANSKYKNSVFTFLFSKPETLRELYCALEGVTLPDDVPVTINTLEDVLFMERMNDISFEIGGKLVVLIEHQSTINPNMALRLLMYITRVYEKIIDDRKIYSRQKITIPTPEFYVLYNGVQPYHEKTTLKLSGMFENLQGLGLPDKQTPALELIVKVININEGKNEEIIKRCNTLSGYSAFVAKVRKYEEEGLSREEAVKKAVYYCRNHDILREFFEEHAREVMSFLTVEWDWDTAFEVAHEEGREEKSLEIARRMKARGRTLEEISEDTDLDIETIKNL
jgi:predicted transposase/invertase (TIGR01784 family)